MVRALFWLVALLLAALALRVWLGPAPAPENPVREERDAGAPPLDDIDEDSREALLEILREAGKEGERSGRER